MKFVLLSLAAMSIMAACCSCSNDPKEDPAPIYLEDTTLPIADPYVMSYDGKYYAYGTGGNPSGAGEGIACFSSDNLRYWKREGQALYARDSYGDKWFWAPEVYHINGKFYMFYSAEERMCVATSDSPAGPFVQQEKKPMISSYAIDTSLFHDNKTGKYYLYFVRRTDGNAIWVAEMNDDLTGIREETMKLCFAATEPWELKWPKVVEGPSVLEKDGTYYMLYSANSYESQDYAVGYATSDSPVGPWTKSAANPILRRFQGLFGTGHGAPFQTPEGEWKYIFHAHASAGSVQPRSSYIADFDFTPGALAIKPPLISPAVVK